MLPILHLASFLKIWCLTTIGGFFLKVSVFSLVLEPNCSSILKDCYLSAMLTQASRRLDIREFCLFISGLLNWIASADSRHIFFCISSPFPWILNTVICRSELSLEPSAWKRFSSTTALYMPWPPGQTRPWKSTGATKVPASTNGHVIAMADPLHTEPGGYDPKHGRFHHFLSRSGMHHSWNCPSLNFQHLHINIPFFGCNTTLWGECPCFSWELRALRSCNRLPW